jgi:hypothetical protein
MHRLNYSVRFNTARKTERRAWGKGFMPREKRALPQSQLS